MYMSCFSPSACDDMIYRVLCVYYFRSQGYNHLCFLLQRPSCRQVSALAAPPQVTSVDQVSPMIE